MITNKTIITVVGKKPIQIYNWWISLDNERYTNWHPDHKYWHWLSSDKQRRRLKFREKMGPVDFKFTGFFTKKVPGKCILFTHLFLPIKIQFTFEEINNGTKVFNEVMIGSNGNIGKLFDGIIKILFFSSAKQKITDQHMSDEYKIFEKFSEI